MFNIRRINSKLLQQEDCITCVSCTSFKDGFFFQFFHRGMTEITPTVRNASHLTTTLRRDEFHDFAIVRNIFSIFWSFRMMFDFTAPIRSSWSFMA